MNPTMPPDVALCYTYLKESRPSLTLEQALTQECEATFEHHFPEYDLWVYTVNHHLFQGELIAVKSKTPLLAEQTAQEGLQATLEEFRAYNAALPGAVETDMQPTGEQSLIIH